MESNPRNATISFGLDAFRKVLADHSGSDCTSDPFFSEWMLDGDGSLKEIRYNAWDRNGKPVVLKERTLIAGKIATLDCMDPDLRNLQDKAVEEYKGYRKFLEKHCERCEGEYAMSLEHVNSILCWFLRWSDSFRDFIDKMTGGER